MRADQNKGETTNVVSIFAKEKVVEGRNTKKKKIDVKQEEEVDFAEEVRRNQEIKERMKKERMKANRSVLRSYRLKT